MTDLERPKGLTKVRNHEPISATYKTLPTLEEIDLRIAKWCAVGGAVCVALYLTIFIVYQVIAA